MRRGELNLNSLDLKVGVVMGPLTECSIDGNVLGVSGETNVERSFVTCIVYIQKAKSPETRFFASKEQVSQRILIWIMARHVLLIRMLPVNEN